MTDVIWKCNCRTSPYFDDAHKEHGYPAETDDYGKIIREYQPCTRTMKAYIPKSTVDELVVAAKDSIFMLRYYSKHGNHPYGDMKECKKVLQELEQALAKVEGK